ncbi:hypothetical protein [Cytobacillus firmus]|uniref:hypothetical protein n=1 Tax=Cytobacillus firmus TaxID=1399 RepID=UPI0018CE5035|nr:hypothetical protein [Cytobacillus firmus]MED1909087.1 hypothetical protein [Cytobacillus firmus]
MSLSVSTAVAEESKGAYPSSTPTASKSISVPKVFLPVTPESAVETVTFVTAVSMSLAVVREITDLPSTTSLDTAVTVDGVPSMLAVKSVALTFVINSSKYNLTVFLPVATASSNNGRCLSI